MNENCTETLQWLTPRPVPGRLRVFTLAAHGFVLRSEWNPIYNTAIQEHEKPGNCCCGNRIRGDALRDMPEPLHG